MNRFRFCLYFAMLFLGLISFSCVMGTESDTLSEKMKEGEELIWSRFYSPVTNQFYDYLTSYEPGRGLDHLPKAEEIDREYPNDCGYGTGMEDCMISAGVMMTAVLHRYAVDQYFEGAERAEKIFAGIERSLQSVPGEGFPARGISPYAPDRFYIGSSRDQLTHAVAGLWDYYRSGLPDESVKKRIRELVKNAADRMIRNVTPENDYDFLRADGSPCPRGICKMERVLPHEAARLAMIYAVAWDITGEELYRSLWRDKISDAAYGSLNPLASTAAYGLLQMQDSLRILDKLESESAVKKVLRQASAQASELARGRISRLTAAGPQYDLTELAPDWRKVGGLVDPYRRVWYYPRECGEILLTLLLDPNESFNEDDEVFLKFALEQVDFSRNSSCGLFDLLAAWWTFLLVKEDRGI